MGMLTGTEIKNRIEKGSITISDFSEENLNPNSYNLTLSPVLKLYDTGFIRHTKKSDPNSCVIYGNGYEDVIDSAKDNISITMEIPDEGLVLYPGVIYLGSTNEYTESKDVIPCISGRSSIGRLGINIHATAGFGDIGFCGTWTLEISVIEPVRIYPNMKICQIYFYTPTGSTDIKYNGKYMNQSEPISSKLYAEMNS